MNLKNLLIVVAILSVASFAFATTTTMTKTIDNVKAAITGETNASAKYAAYAQKAREEGYEKIALLFEATSKAEAIHAGNHRAVMDQLAKGGQPQVEPKFQVKTTMENLQDAIQGETYEVSTMYPQFIKESNKSRVNIATLSFNYAYQTEQKHKVLFQNALAALKGGKQDTLPGKYFVCTNCGNTYDNEAAARCAICMTEKDRFVVIA